MTSLPPEDTRSWLDRARGRAAEPVGWLPHRAKRSGRRANRLHDFRSLSKDLRGGGCRRWDLQPQSLGLPAVRSCGGE